MYKCPGLICLALPARQKFGLILVIKFFLVEVIKKIILTKNVRLTYYFSMKKKIRHLDGVAEGVASDPHDTNRRVQRVVSW